MSELLDKIINAKEIFGDKAIQLIVSELKIDGWDDKNKEGICPFHKKDGHAESTPSFKWNKKDNAFTCFGCGARYGVLDYYSAIGLSKKQSIEKLFSETGLSHSFTSNVKSNYRYPKTEDNESLDKVIKYLKDRKISEETIRDIGIKQDVHGNMVFEYFDENDKLLLSKYRPTRKLKKGEVKTWCQEGADTDHILFGMDKIDLTKPLIITEGEIDKLSAHECGYTNAVSVPFGANNYQWIERNWEWLDTFTDFIICADNDEAGKKMLNEVVPRLGEWRCRTLRYPNNPNGAPCNDLNEILYYYGIDGLHTIIASAEDVPIKNIVNMAHIRDIDLSTMAGVKTRIKPLDQRLSKIFMGTFIVWTGINGSGKSSLINQLVVAESVDQGFKTFIYSGELSKEQLRNWIDYPIAGRHNISEIKKGDDQPLFYKVNEATKRKMESWYDEKIFIYDDELDVSANAILNKMELLARKHGVKVFLLDNLMTINLYKLEGADKNDKETQFIIKLKEFAIKYNVAVHLVAHPRKLDIVKRLSKMDVSGSGNITNLAHYVFAVHRVTRAEKEGKRNLKGEIIEEAIDYDTILDCFKNRPVGFQDFEIGLYFDMKSKRFYKTEQDLNRKYGWDTETKVNEDGVIIDFTYEESNPFD